MRPLATLLDQEIESVIGMVSMDIIGGQNLAQNINARPSQEVYDAHLEEYERLSDLFVSKFVSRETGRKILERIPELVNVPHILRYYIGANEVLRRVTRDFQGPEDYGQGLEAVFPNAESIALYCLNRRTIPSKPEVEELESRLFPDLSGDTRAAVFQSYEWLRNHLSSKSEFLIREGLAIFQRKRGFGGDTFLLPVNKFDGRISDSLISIFKEYYGLVLKDDFDDAYQAGQERKRRFSPKDGRAHYKQVKLQLHEDLIPVLTEALGGANRNAWIEEAIVEKLQREGVEIEMTEQPPLPNR